MDLNTGTPVGRMRSASLDLLRSASLDLLKSSSISLLKSVANSSTSNSDSVAQHLKVGGGMTNNNLLMQFQADLLGLSLYRPYVSDYLLYYGCLSCLIVLSCPLTAIHKVRHMRMLSLPYSFLLSRTELHCIQLPRLHMSTFVCLTTSFFQSAETTALGAAFAAGLAVGEQSNTHHHTVHHRYILMLNTCFH